MLSRRLASAMVLAAALCLTTLGVNVASASPSSTPATSPHAAAAASSLMADCFVYNGDRRGCTYFNLDNMTFRICDYIDPGGVRYTTGRISVEGKLAYENTIAGGTSTYCGNGIPIQVAVGERVCIHTGVQGLGWTTAECRTYWP